MPPMTPYEPPSQPFYPPMVCEVDSDAYALVCPGCNRVVISDDCGIAGATVDIGDGGDVDSETLMFCPACDGWVHMDRDRLPTATVVRTIVPSGQKVLF